MKSKLAVITSTVLGVDVLRTKAKHSTSANIVFWRRQYCERVMRMKIYRTRNHDVIFDEWWALQ
eukprot:10151719-Heterocapsa_arctica.AAC.1